MPVLSRRHFLRAAASLAALTGISGAPSFAADGPRRGDLATLIDCTLCDGCVDHAVALCVAACRERALERIPDPEQPIPKLFPRGQIEDWSERKDVLDRLTPYTQIYVQRADVGEGDDRRTVYLPRRCMHCDNPPCATICPFTANHKYPNGAVVIDDDLCFGGAKCRDVCPWGIPQRQSGLGIYLNILPTLAGNGVMFKCDLCYDRLMKQRVPLCVEACPRGAMIIGLRRDIFNEAERRAARTGGRLYGNTENGGTGTIYLSPVPFEDINAVLAKGPGRPHLDRVERRLARASILEASVLMAPVAGMGAGIAAAVAALKQRGKDNRDGGGCD
ncbi:MAG: 4Fe-4S dicluster domain-containing protein [Syntrophales bacterium]|nr:4Fe-4S dicluster domain-containing protein [Syntrophales bacterium]MCK9527285.1 4Fe-4S dicluster domain-containing protein [Syntrophales bacterium]MDX9921245.1 4Fe-4S dicluster domain-containing protein [Syntrophales bacterium]